MAAVAVVVVNWNSGDLLARCLSSVLAQDPRPDEVVVVDNASTDGSAARIEGQFPGVKLVRSSKNLGFAGGNNRGFEEASGSEWIALMNPDAFAEPDWLEKLLAAAADHPDCGSVGSRLVRADDASTLDGIGDVYHVSGLHWREGFNKPAAGRGVRPMEIFSPCAAAALYRVSALKEAGPFDADYFCYSEDVDLGFRLRLLGYSCWYAPDSVAHHVGSAITGGRSDFTMYHGVRNGIWTYVKNMPALLAWLCLPALVLGYGSVAVKLTLRGQGSPAWRGIRDAIKGLPRALRKRAEIQAARRVSAWAIWRMLDKSLPGMRR